ncbi:hypothetical protein E2542_SST04035 [Spatholobus suberectus]|nr:hypothetical protein E2542_SST04035 [Spatholobus suberectus]
MATTLMNNGLSASSRLETVLLAPGPGNRKLLLLFLDLFIFLIVKTYIILSPSSRLLIPIKLFLQAYKNELETKLALLREENSRLRRQLKQLQFRVKSSVCLLKSALCIEPRHRHFEKQQSPFAKGVKN